MITFLSGVLAAKKESSAVVSVGGVGFEAAVSLSTYRELPRIGEPVTLHTHLIVREDEISLCGFAKEEEREMFRILLGVSGVGVKMAMDILSSLPAGRIVDAVQRSDSAVLCQIPGIGKKRAERLIFNLKQLTHPLLLAPAAGMEVKTTAALPQNEAIREAVAALEALGCKPFEAQRAIVEAVSILGEQAAVSALIKEGLHRR
ncbi:MAG: Holliday junction branch migration protein RuvA [Candidatus Omnitrophica bacterium]|nr:Holliday junction branch migration protein RuvA [Candidatus Omnitrophota bacterium]